jgi:hypothetical protein
MRFLGLPNESTLKFYNACSSGVGSADKKNRLRIYRGQVIGASDAYEASCKTHQIHQIISSYVEINKLVTVPYVSKEELNRLYEYQIKEGRPGRDIYNRLLVTPNRRCPFCSVGTVKNLDHFIPKAHFPIFSVTTSNLVPSCRDCNMDKNSDFSTDIRKQTLHPYFDNVSDVQWLYAEIVDNSFPVVVNYFVDTSLIKSSALASKVVAHFEEYDLANIFIDLASVRVNEIHDNCKKRFQEGGANSLKKFLGEAKNSEEKVFKNSWSVAMYGALLDSNWFCERAFESNRREASSADSEKCDVCEGKEVLDCKYCKPYNNKDCSVCQGSSIMTSSNCPACKGTGLSASGN